MNPLRVEDRAPLVEAAQLDLEHLAPGEEL